MSLYWFVKFNCSPVGVIELKGHVFVFTIFLLFILVTHFFFHSTVTTFAKFFGLSGLIDLSTDK
jgi:hypothetical protein